MPSDPNPATPDQQIDTFRTLERWLVCADGTTIEERAEAFAAAVRAVVTVSKPERERARACPRCGSTLTSDGDCPNLRGCELGASSQPAVPLPLVRTLVEAVDTAGRDYANPNKLDPVYSAARALRPYLGGRGAPAKAPPPAAQGEQARANVPDLNHANRHGTELKAAPPPPASPTPPVVPPVGPDECVVIDRDTAAAFMAGWDKQWEEAKRMRGGTWVLPWAEPMVNQLRDRLAARVTPSQEGRG